MGAGSGSAIHGEGLMDKVEAENVLQPGNGNLADRAQFKAIPKLAMLAGVSARSPGMTPDKVIVH
jgi:hypothetical protein